MLLLHTSDARSTQCRFQDHQTSFFAGRFFVVQHINFDTAPWPVNTALFWIFLSDNKEMRQQRQLRNEQYDSISEWLNAAQSEERNKITLPLLPLKNWSPLERKSQRFLQHHPCFGYASHLVRCEMAIRHQAIFSGCTRIGAFPNHVDMEHKQFLVSIESMKNRHHTHLG
jgi:hypothetical protein